MLAPLLFVWPLSIAFTHYFANNVANFPYDQALREHVTAISRQVKLVNGKPEFMSKDAKPANKGGTYWIREEDKVAFDDSKFKAGDEVASIAIAPFTGDRGDIKFAAKWANGKWTMEIARKLVTGSKTDVNFDDLKKSYGFGVAFFDNAQVRHAVVKEPMVLQFK